MDTFKKAKKNNIPASFSKAQPDKLFIQGKLWQSNLFLLGITTPAIQELFFTIIFNLLIYKHKATITPIGLYYLHVPNQKIVLLVCKCLFVYSFGPLFI